MPVKKNPRKDKLDKIMTKLAMFIVQDTFSDEPEVQKLISDAIDLLDKAAVKMVANDDAEAARVAAKAITPAP